jgi:lipoprotein-anchoring transpeptidase ErfK/SrfK
MQQVASDIFPGRSIGRAPKKNGKALDAASGPIGERAVCVFKGVSGVGVGGEGFGWSGVAMVHTKQEWPDWRPPAEMLERKPELIEHMTQLQSGIGMPGGPDNPLGARALYLWQGNKDTLYRIHGTNEPWTIGHSVSAGCIRMTNEDVADLYDRIPVGTRVIVLAKNTSGESG